MTARFRTELTAAVFGAMLAAGVFPASAEKFTVAVVSDTQNYTDVTLPQPRGVNTFIQQMQYLVDSRKEKNLAFVTFVGDIVQHGDGQFRTGIIGQYTLWDTRTEWDYANLAVSVLSATDIPFGMVPGNHDYDNYSWYTTPNGPGASRPLRGGTLWNAYFGPASRHFAGKAWYGGGNNNGMDSYQVFEAGGRKFLHLGLQMEPTPADLDWARQVIAANEGLPTILTIHEWLDPNFTGETTRSNDYKAYFDGAANLPPDETWEKFIRKTPQIFMVLAGHDWTPTVAGVSQGQNLRVDTNDAGYPVYQTVQDYQGNTIGPDGKPDSANGGAGWLRFIEFDTDAKKMHYYTYSTLLDKYAGRDGEASFGVAPNYSDFTVDFPPQLTK
ncbi:metallophosphoesterase [Pleomorphomonas carboxyditropha]|nr:metallophosphoesterase [Pleomorphomonas carboxyditropha]